MDEREQKRTDDGIAPRGRRMGLRVALIVVGTLAAAVIAGAVVFLVLLGGGNPALSRRVISALNEAVGTDSTRFACDRVRATLFRGAVLDRPRLLVRTTDGEVTWVEAARLRADYDLFQLLLSRRRRLRVVIDSPRITLRHDREGDLVMPRFAPSPRARPSKSETSVEVEIRNGGLSLDREGIQFGGIKGTADLTLGSSRASLLIRGLSGSSETPGRPGSLAVNGLISVDGSTLRADPFEVAVGSSKISTALEWDLRSARVIEGTLSLRPLRLREFFHAFQIESGEGELTGEVDFSGTPSDGRASVCLAGRYAGEPIDTLLFLAKSRPGAIEIGGIRVRVRGAEVTGGGTVLTSGSLTADLGFHGVDPALLPLGKAPIPEGDLSGSARVEARRATPRPDVTVALRLDASRVGTFRLDRGYVQARLPRSGGVAIDSAYLETPGAHVIAAGTLEPDSTIAADVEGIVADLSSLDPYMKPLNAESGVGTFSGELGGTVADPRFRLQVDLRQARFQDGIGCDTLTAEVQGRIKPSVDLTADIGARGVSASGRHLGNADVILAGGRTLRIQRYRQAVGDTVLSLQGEITFEDERTTARLDSLSFVAGPHHIRNQGVWNLEISKRRFSASGITLDLSPGTLRADVDWDPGRGTIEARGLIEGLDLSRLAEIQPRDSRVAGIAEGEFSASGPIADPDVALRVAVQGPAVGQVVGDTLVVDADYAPGVLNLTRAAWVAGRSRLSVVGSLRPRFTLEDWVRALGKKDHSWADRTDLALSVVADSFNLGRIAPADSSLLTLEGRATLHARVSGTPNAPVIAFEGNAPHLGYRGVEAEIPVARLSYRDRRLTIQPIQVRQGTSVSEIRGEIPMVLSLYQGFRVPGDEPMALTITMPDANLAVAPLLIPDVAASTGRITATAEVRGTPHNPNVTGSFRIRDGGLRLAGRDEVLEAISVDAAFDEEQVTLTRATATQAKRGKLAVTGYWRWPTAPQAPGAPPPVGPRGQYNFHVNATDFTVTDRENYLLRFSGDLYVVNALSPTGAEVPSVTGTVVVSKGELTMDLTKPPTEPSAPLPILYNVKAEIPGNLFYRTLDAEVELSADELIFKNEGKGDIALGELTVEGGKYYILTRQFGNLSGTINCNNPDRLDPEVNITAETQIPRAGAEEKVYLALTGKVSELKVRAYDDNNTPSNDLWKAIALGAFVPSSGVDVAQGGTTGQESAAGVALPITNYLFQNVERWIGSTGFIDTIDLRSSGSTGTSSASAGPISVVGVGKYVTPEFYLKYTRDFTASATEQINADYRITRSLFLKGQQIRRPTGQGTQPQQEYNVDLKVRLEY